MKNMLTNPIIPGYYPDPSICRVGDDYLIIADDGTEHYHAVMASRSKDIFGFYEGDPANPVMTHRHMGFKCPITNIGHADLVELPDGSWYAVMLGSRLIADNKEFGYFVSDSETTITTTKVLHSLGQ